MEATTILSDKKLGSESIFNQAFKGAGTDSKPLAKSRADQLLYSFNDEKGRTSQSGDSIDVSYYLDIRNIEDSKFDASLKEISFGINGMINVTYCVSLI